MNYSQRVEALTYLGDILGQINETNRVLYDAQVQNAWFTIPNQLQAIEHWSNLLKAEKINIWLGQYPISNEQIDKTVAIIMAGNIPLVGLHDLVCAFACGFNLMIKPSSDDTVLIEWIVESLYQKYPETLNLIQVVKDKKLVGFDSVIATGSNNSFRYFEYYFRGKPSLLRKNRNSIAVLSGNESDQDLDLLSDDVLSYFGLGCRNVSKVFIPEGYDIKKLIQKLEKYNNYIHHHKFANNYTYHKAIFLLNMNEHLDAGFLIIKQDEKNTAPIGVLFYDFYRELSDVNAFLNEQHEAVQCIVSKLAIAGAIPFGSSQQPGLEVYADGIDTISFLCNQD